jgi:hypothetical protein
VLAVDRPKLSAGFSVIARVRKRRSFSHVFAGLAEVAPR